MKLSFPFALLFLGTSFLPCLGNETLEFKTFPPGITFLLSFILVLILAMNLKTSARQIFKTLIILKKESSVGKFWHWTNTSTNIEEALPPSTEHARAVFTQACRYQASLRVMTFLNTISVVLCDTNQILQAHKGLCLCSRLVPTSVVKDMTTSSGWRKKTARNWS